MFDRDQFVAHCQAASAGDRASRNVHEVVKSAVANPRAIIRAVGEPARGALDVWYKSPELTVLNVVWPPGMIIMPHNHTMWAVMGVYDGREDNILWQRPASGTIEAAGAKTLSAAETVAFGPDVIHSVVNPLDRRTSAIHVYGGDFFAAHRSEWDPESLQEHPYDMEKARRMFER